MKAKHDLKRSLRRLILLALMPVATATSIFIAPYSALANCAGEPPDEVVVPLVQQRWQELQRMQTYPWGTARVYDRLDVDRRQVWFNANFNQLRGTQKQQAIEMLQLGSSPFRAYASDGRLLSARYDGCTRFDTLTERARYGYYFNEIGRSLPSNTPRDQLRNVGRPAWRQVRYPITAATERSVRTLFWNRMGYAQANSGMWIAWVPEQGYFEINVPNGYNVQQLSRFWGAAPRQYRYIVVQTDGTTVFDANFD
ncbi:hypothetical protein H6F67_13495 [Microcoleus sp. FACHB-1515]|uniref:hypothetical protein n=1 Tax=Cyanophyceae TaxID=3028117 RepID=UPI00168A03B9|nr:hypothetical protein [Microcoleus sp. FACHB-1515]MBD2090865.1 hypothetical protein [Microcoleus sp. FACHB-1515]